MVTVKLTPPKNFHYYKDKVQQKDRGITINPASVIPTMSRAKAKGTENYLLLPFIFLQRFEG